VGGGPAGIGAAVAARRYTNQVILIERYGFLGGMATAGLVTPISSIRINNHIVSAIISEILDRLKKETNSFGFLPYRDEGESILIEPEALKLILPLYLKEKGVELLLHSLVTGCRVEEDRIKEIIIQSKHGEITLNGEVFIDATGDADIAVSAGVPYHFGREKNGAIQPMTLFFKLGGIKVKKAKNWINRPISFSDLGLTREKFEKLSLEAPGFANFSSGNVPLPQGRILFAPLPRQGEVMMNVTRIKGSGINYSEITKAEIKAREQILVLLKIIRNLSGFEKAYLIEVAPQIGVRETRRIKGLYTLTERDVIKGQIFSDGIARGNYPIDIHNPTGEGGGEWKLLEAAYYEIPYRALLPEKIRNLLVCGRCISATHRALASTRIMGTCIATGEAAGTAAAFALQEGVSPRELRGEEIRKELRDKGAYV